MNLREIDELVITKVLGMEKENFGEDWEWIKRDNSGEIVDWYTQWFSPATNIYDAWYVVIKLHEYGGCEIGCYGTGEEKWYEVTLRRFSNEIKATAQTAPLAICLAALRMKGVSLDGTNHLSSVRR